MARRSFSKAARNEHRKLRATYLNAIGLAVAAVGVVQTTYTAPLTADAVKRIAVSAVIAYILHWIASGALNRLED